MLPCKQGETAASTGCIPASGEVTAHLKETPSESATETTSRREEASPKQRQEIVKKQAAEVQFSDEVVNEVEEDDYDAIRDTMTSEELTEMNESIEEQLREEAEVAADEMDYDIDEYQVARYADLDWDSITDHVEQLINKYGGEQTDEILENVEWPHRRLYGPDLIERILGNMPEDIPDQLQSELDDYQQIVTDEMEAALERERDSMQESYMDEYMSRASSYDLERDYLRNFYNNNPQRFRSSMEDKVWYTDADGDGVCQFTTSSGTVYNVHAVGGNSKFEGEVIEDLQFSDESGSYKITNAGNAFEVFSTVVPLMVAYIQHKDKKLATFTAAEPSRQRLYDRLVKTMIKTAPGYSGFYVDKGTTRYYTIVKTDLEGPFMDKLQKAGIDLNQVNPLHSKKSLEDGGVVYRIKPEINPAWWTVEGWEDTTEGDTTNRPKPSSLPPKSGKKDLSWLAETSGGALVKPAKQKKRFKSLREKYRRGGVR